MKLFFAFLALAAASTTTPQPTTGQSTTADVVTAQSTAANATGKFYFLERDLCFMTRAHES